MGARPVKSFRHRFTEDSDTPVVEALGFAAHKVAVVTTVNGDADGINEVQVGTLDVNGGTGDLTLTVAGETTGAIAHDATGATVTTAIDATGLSAGDVVVTGGAGGPWTFTFGAALAATNQADITADLTGITGDTPDATFDISTTTTGVEATAWEVNVNGRLAGVSGTVVELADHVSGADTAGAVVHADVTGIVTEIVLDRDITLGAADSVDVEVVVLGY